MPSVKEKPSSVIRRLADHPTWQAGLQKQARLREAFRVADEQRRAHEGTLPDSDQQVRIANATAALLSDAPAAAVATFNIEEYHAAKAACEQYNGELERLRTVLADQIWREAWEPDHFALLREEARAVVILKKAGDASTAFAEQARQAGVLPGFAFVYRHRLNASACGALPKAVATMNLRHFIESNKNLLT